MSPTNQGTSEGPLTSEQEYLTRVIRLFWVHLDLDIIWKVIYEKEVKMDHTKMNPKYLDSSCQEVYNRGLGIVICSPSGSLGNWFFVCLYWGTNLAVQLDWPSETITHKIAVRPRGLQQIQNYVQKALIKKHPNLWRSKPHFFGGYFWTITFQKMIMKLGSLQIWMRLDEFWCLRCFWGASVSRQIIFLVI